MKVVLIGPPASGKGTQAQLLEKYLNLKHISTGDLFRKIMKEDTALGKEVKKYMDKAMLVPDDLTIKVLKQELEQIGNNNFILDGYPRTLNQAKNLSKYIGIDKYIDLDVGLDNIKNRIENRRICQRCGQIYNKLIDNIDDEICKKCGDKLVKRKDDKQDIVVSRYKEFEKLTKPVIKYYKDLGILKTIDGEGSVQKVFENIKQYIEEGK